MKIRVLITGGTIDDLDYNSDNNVPENHKSLVPDLLRQARLKDDFELEVLIQKDSKFVDDKDRALIKSKCEQCLETRIIITHGTMTMPQTAEYLGNNLKEKTIVLMGSAIPANKENSDALFNLGFALAAVQFLPHGVYVAMNGKIFAWNNVRKNLDSGYFEENKG